VTYRWLFERVLAHRDAEAAHRAGLAAIRLFGRTPVVPGVVRRRSLPADPETKIEALGLRFPGLLGIAAGFDKNAEAIDGLAALGFAFVEVGTVTGQPQPGNDRPRLFRLVQDRAIINRMGFNNDGAQAVAERLAARTRRRDRRRGRRAGGRRADVIVGINIGKTKMVPESEAVADYELSARLLAPHADYLVVNVSSPNTPGLRDLQAVDRLRPLLVAVRAAAEAAAGRHVPLLVKIAPDLTDSDVLAVAGLAVELRLDGIVATNTTVDRAGLQTDPAQVAALGAGGLSGVPLRNRSLEVLRLLADRVGDRLVLISVGGVTTAEDVLERLAAGATLVQAYTAFVYEGPRWPRRVQAEIAARRRTVAAR
jgi:dihydroorotate dehydrogenase